MEVPNRQSNWVKRGLLFGIVASCVPLGACDAPPIFSPPAIEEVLQTVPTVEEVLETAPEGLPELPRLSWGEFREEAISNARSEALTAEECQRARDVFDQWQDDLEFEEGLLRFGENFANDPLTALVEAAIVVTYHYSGLNELVDASETVIDILNAVTGGCDALGEGVAPECRSDADCPQGFECAGGECVTGGTGSTPTVESSVITVTVICDGANAGTDYRVTLFWDYDGRTYAVDEAFTDLSGTVTFEVPIQRMETDILKVATNPSPGHGLEPEIQKAYTMLPEQIVNITTDVCREEWTP